MEPTDDAGPCPGYSPPDADSVVRAILALRPALAARGVVSASLFGSVARGEADKGSDVDLMIVVDPGGAFDLVDLLAVRNMIADAAGRDADVIERVSLKPLIRDRVLAEATPIF